MNDNGSCVCHVNGYRVKDSEARRLATTAGQMANSAMEKAASYEKKITDAVTTANKAKNTAERVEVTAKSAYTTATDAATAAAGAAADAAAALPKSGGTMTGDIDMNGREIDHALYVRMRHMVLEAAAGVAVEVSADPEGVFQLFCERNMSAGITRDGSTVLRGVADPDRPTDAANKRYIDDALLAAVPDWTENNAASRGYIRNRPFYTGDPVTVCVVQETTLECPAENALVVSAEIVAGATATVTFDGNKYTCSVVEEFGGFVIGNMGLFAENPVPGEFPFAFVAGDSFNILVTETPGEHTVKIDITYTPVKTLPAEYLPQIPAAKVEKSNAVVYDLFALLPDFTLVSDSGLNIPTFTVGDEINFDQLPQKTVVFSGGYGLLEKRTVAPNYTNYHGVEMYESGTVRTVDYIFVHASNVYQGIQDYKNDNGIE